MSGEGSVAAGFGPGVVANRIRRGFYLDSVALMRVSAALSARDDVLSASLMIGTPSNLAILEDAALLTDDGRAAGPNDLVIAIRAGAEKALAAALEAAESSLAGAESGGRDGHAAGRFPGFKAACEGMPGANLAIVSVPGPFAAREARRVLAAGLHVLVFSDNVPVEEEAALKREGLARGQLVMGPDCGTAIIGGTPLAFANRVRSGDIGAIAASGTGLQELSVLVHRGGGGLSHGIGVGGRDLSDEVGGLATFMALGALETDPATRHIVIVSKPPGPRTEEALVARLGECAKPVTLFLVGRDRDDGGLPLGTNLAPTLRDAARLALGGGDGDGRPSGDPGTGASAARGAPLEAGRIADNPQSAPPASTRPGRIIGLYCGGTLCAEGQAIVRRAGRAVVSNAPIPGAGRLEAGTGGPLAGSSGHTFIDLGADEYTAGRPHPMIEPGLRSGPLAAALADPSAGAVVLDVVLGTGSHPDPAAPIVEVLESAGHARPPVIASVCGTELDPQDYAAQRRALEKAGAFVAESNADAVEEALRIAASDEGGFG
ncbi:MAG: hypothetical protein OXC01_14080 [Immundisolibacterales bacterium]|nr:hypothetical protein [Immundisolibacterales bacterium]